MSLEPLGTALKPAHEPIILARKPLSVGGRKATVADNVLTHGTGALNIDAARIGTGGDIPSVKAVRASDYPQSHKPGEGAGWGRSRAGYAGDTVDWQPSGGRWPANVVLGHHEDCVEVGTTVLKGGRPIRVSEQRADTLYESSVYAGRVDNNSLAPGSRSLGAADQEIPVFDCHPDCAVRMLDAQTGTLTSGKPAGGDGPHLAKASVGVGDGAALEGSADGSLRSEGVEYHLYGDSGGASRFFYCAKTSKSERNAGLPDGVKNDHPTVKPVKLMEWLVKLVTPPGGTVLDPFCGSGTTGIAAVKGFGFIGIDQDKHYCNIAYRRIKHHLEET